MKLSVIWNLSEKDSDNQITLDCLKTELVDYKDPVQILIYPQNKEQLDHTPLIVNNGEVIISSLIGASEIEVYEDTQKLVDGDFVTYLYGGDRWSSQTLSQLQGILKDHSDLAIVMMHKIMPDEREGAFAREIPDKKIVNLSLKKDYDVYPFYFGGTILSAEAFRSHSFQKKLGIEAEREYLSLIHISEPTKP